MTPLVWHVGGKRCGPIVGNVFNYSGDHHLATNWWQQFWAQSYESSCPCPEPMPDEFRARFPEFKDFPDAQITYALYDASCWVDTSWSSRCEDCTRAIMFLAAHFLALGAIAAEALPKPIPDGEGGVILPGGEVTSLGFEGMRVGFASPKFAASSGRGGSGGLGGKGSYDLESTPYGQRYLDLLQVNKPAVLVV